MQSKKNGIYKLSKSHEAKIMGKCLNCGSENSDNAKFCISCGKKYFAQVICSKCNSLNPARAEFCGECGHPLNKRPSILTIVFAIIIFIVVSLLIGYMFTALAQAQWNAST